ncbi:MAG: nucleotidyl transferase AbiEii/AbiGii toxin family protein [Planctomycetota bacterium]
MNHHLYPIARAAILALRDAQADFALIGGMAIAFRTQPRFTQDLDFAVAVVDDAQAEVIARAMHLAGFPVTVELDHVVTGRLATLRLQPVLPDFVAEQDTQAPFVDLLFAANGIEPETVAESTPLEIMDGLTLPVARVPHLMAMKLLSASKRRKQDYVDLDHLIAVATDDDLATVRDLLALIAQRGHAPDPPTPDLPTRFADLLDEHGRT